MGGIQNAVMTPYLKIPYILYFQPFSQYYNTKCPVLNYFWLKFLKQILLLSLTLCPDR